MKNYLVWNGTGGSINFLRKSLNPNQGSFNESEEKDWRFS